MSESFSLEVGVAGKERGQRSFVRFISLLPCSCPLARDPCEITPPYARSLPRVDSELEVCFWLKEPERKRRAFVLPSTSTLEAVSPLLPSSFLPSHRGPAFETKQESELTRECYYISPTKTTKTALRKEEGWERDGQLLDLPLSPFPFTCPFLFPQTHPAPKA